MAGFRVTLRQHRFEVVAAALLAVVAAAYILYGEARLAAVGASPDCIKDWLTTGSTGREQCAGPMARWAGIFGSESEYTFAMMKFLPFVAGLVAGVPLVAREIETRTAQTAWSLNGSRVAWLGRQALPVFVVVLVPLAAAAAAAGFMAQHRIDWGQGAFPTIGLHGIGVLVRFAAGFAIGTFAGALLGRTLPALLIGALLVAATFLAVDNIRQAWIRAQPTAVVGESTTAIVVSWTWRTPDGKFLSVEEAEELVPAEVLETDDEQGASAAEWLQAHGYVAMQVGVTDEVAKGWANFDVALFGGAVLSSAAGASWLVNRKRPT